MAKVTLYIDDEQVLERAKAYAKRQGVSLSKLVQQVLATLPNEIRIGKEPLTGATSAVHRTEEDLRILAEDAARAAPQLGAETGGEIDADRAMVRAFPGHGVDHPIEIFVVLV
jgi:Family of unknown function (DUF6364)